MKKWLWFVIFILFVSFACKKTGEEFDETLKKDYEHISEVPPGEMLKFLKESYRLKPDKRFLLAIGEVDYFFSSERGQIDVQFDKKGQWNVFVNKKKIGVLPEFPGFSDIVDLLIKRAGFMQDKNSLSLNQEKYNPDIIEIMEKKKNFSPHVLFSILKKIGADWQKNIFHPDLLKYAIRALILLSFQSFDLLEQGDFLFAKALAFLAITRVMTKKGLIWEECILAYAMDYSAHSLQLATQMNESEAFVLFALRKNQKLKAEVEKNGNYLSRFLYLFRFAEKRNIQSWLKLKEVLFKDDEILLPVLRAGLELNRFSLRSTFSRMLPIMVLIRMVGEIKNPSAKNNLENQIDKIKNNRLEISTIIHTFESNLKTLKGNEPFLDDKIFQDFFRGYFYSSLYTYCIHLLDKLASVPAAVSFITELGNHEFETAKEFVKWYSDLVFFNQKKADLNILLDDLKQFNYIRGKSILRTFKDIRKYANYNNPYLINSARLLVKKLDSRIEHRFFLAGVANRDLYDLNLLEKLLAGMAKNLSLKYPQIQIWYALYNHDFQKLKQMLSRSDIMIWQRVNILRDLEDCEDKDLPDFQNEYEKLVSEDPDSWYVVDRYSSYLKNKKKYKLASKVILDWLNTHDESHGFDYINACKELAKIYLENGLYHKGIRAINPVVDSWQAGVMETKALLLSKIGKRTAAEKLAKKVIERYPRVLRSRAILTSIYWNHEKYNKAGETLKRYPFEYNYVHWKNEIAPSFFKVFEKISQDKISKAFSSLINKKFETIFLLAIPDNFFNEGNSRVAFNLASQIKAYGFNQLFASISAYKYLKHWKGKTIALKWLKKSVPEKLLGFASLVVFEKKEYDLLWDWIKKVRGKASTISLWLMRAAAAIKLGGNKYPHWNEIKRYYNREGRTHYHKIGQYLVGLIPEEEIIKQMTTPKTKCEISYYIGLKKEARGDIYSASDWYRLCIETGLNNNGEFRWALGILNKWALNNRFLKHIVN